MRLYGDVVRYALSEAGISVQRVSGKAVSDYHEIFDGVPSQHDGKDAAMVAELVAHGKGTLWPFATLSEHEQILRHQVFRIDAFRKQQTQWLGRIEALTARRAASPPQASPQGWEKGGVTKKPSETFS